MIYLLDTCVVSDFIKGEPGTLKKVKAIAPSYISLSSLTLFEIGYGLKKNPTKASLIEPILRDFIHVLTILPFAEGEANKAAFIRHELASKGTPIGPYDVLIAATALSQGLILVTANEKEFKRVPGLVVENWRSCEEKEEKA